MLPIKASVQGLFLKQIEERIAKWAASPRIAASLRIPDDLRWVWWQEYGTAARGDAGGSSYSIDPINVSKLAYPGPGGETVLRHHVDHPGIKPSRSITKALPDIKASTATLIDRALQDGAASDPAKLRAAVVESVSNAKALIVESLSVNVPGTRSNTEFPGQDGRLHGQTAASVFDEQATVVEGE